MLGLKIVFIAVFSIWLTLVIAGKGGFAHILLLNAIGIASVIIMTEIRTQLRPRDDSELSM